MIDPPKLIQVEGDKIILAEDQDNLTYGKLFYLQSYDYSCAVFMFQISHIYLQVLRLVKT